MLKISILFALCVVLLSCGLAPSRPVSIQDFRDEVKQKKHLVILLSGRGASFDYFEHQQWVEIARRYTEDYDFIAPFLHYGYFMTGDMTTPLHEDVILPAKKRGYETISLAGISMGGLGSLFYSQKYPDEIDRIFLFSPYLGKDEVHAQIRADGGLDKWRLRMENSGDWNYDIWQHLQDITRHPQSQQKLFLGFGDKDRLTGHDLLASALPAKQVIKLPGNHDDVTFTKLWQAMLEQGFLKR